MELTCPFCNFEKNVLFSNSLVYAKFDIFPVSEGHILIITKRHFDNYFDATKKELKAIEDILKQAKRFLDKKFNPDGYNIGIING